MLMAPPLFHLNFGVFPMHQIAHVRVSLSVSLKLISRIFKVFKPMLARYLNVTDGGTDGQTDDMLRHNRALRIASRDRYGHQVY